MPERACLSTQSVSPWFVRGLALTLLLSVALPGAVTACITQESERNNSDLDANGPVCSGTTVAGNISRNNDIDWFTFDVGGAGTINVSLDHNGRDDFDWFLYPETGGYVASGATSQVPETGSYSVPGAGTYFVKVERYSGRGWYDLTVTYPEGGGGGGGGGGGACNYGPRPSKPGNLQVWQTGDNTDACPTLQGGPGVLLMGGGSDVDSAFTNRVQPVIGSGDVVVLRTSGSNGYNDYLFQLMAPDSVETLLVDSVSKANSDYAEWVIRSAEFLWIAGGDQSDYLNQWQGTKVQSAIQHVYDKGGVIGGTSAGNAVMSEMIYDPDGILAVYSDEAVTDPCHPYINLSTGFLDLPWMQGLINDTHFHERDRMGRLLTFMARIGDSAIPPTILPITGVGVDEATSIYVDGNGYGIVDGSNAVYVLREDASTDFTQIQCGSPVIYGDVLRYRMTTGDWFDFSNGTSSVGASRIDIDGRFSNFYTPSDPY